MGHERLWSLSAGMEWKGQEREVLQDASVLGAELARVRGMA